jgi:dTDP-4-dehydrorhamnose 3,5-epimerase
MRIIDAPIEGVRIVESARYRDERGWFAEVWNRERYRAAGLDLQVAQENVSHSRRGVLRGLHYQMPQAQAKLISVLYGTVFDVVVDMRVGSPTFAAWYGHELSEENGVQLYAPEGFAHGFLALSDFALVHYNCSTAYHEPFDRAVAWNDPDIGVEWPLPPDTISPKDRAAPRLRDIAPPHLPKHDKTSP